MSTKNIGRAEYLWLDGTSPTQEVRTKTRILMLPEQVQLKDFPDWGFDGSSTQQAANTRFSDCAMKPVFFCKDPINKNENHYIVLCEVFTPESKPHSSNKRAELRKLMEKGGNDADIYVGFEQEYTFFADGRPLGWPVDGFPAPQGPFYCGVGTGKVFGRDIVENHLQACIYAGLGIYGTNAEVMPGQWEFQIGYRGIDDEKADPLTMSDHVWVARYLLSRISEEVDVLLSYDNKPVKGDWNGAGMHTNFSSRDTRDPKKGMKAIEEAIQRLEKTHELDIKVYGEGLEDRLTGHHETCSIKEFKSGVSHRGASIRIPMGTAEKGHGYFEDRRPGANADPYIVSSSLVRSVCGIQL